MARGVGRGPKQRIRDADRRREALLMRRRGLTYAQIGAKMGIGTSASHSLVKQALSDLWVENAEELRKLELERMDRMFAGLVREVREFGERSVLGGAYDGFPAAINAALKILERRAKLLGLDAPTPAVAPTDIPPQRIEIKVLRDDDPPENPPPPVSP